MELELSGIRATIYTSENRVEAEHVWKMVTSQLDSGARVVTVPASHNLFGLATDLPPTRAVLRPKGKRLAFKDAIRNRREATP